MYDEFQRYWVVNDPDDLQDRFEEFLKSKHIDPDQIEDYDDFIEAWTEYYDEDLDFDDLESYAWGLYPVDDPDDYDFDPDEYDILLDYDIDYLYDDYLNDYIDDEYYGDYDCLKRLRISVDILRLYCYGFSITAPSVNLYRFPQETQKEYVLPRNLPRSFITHHSSFIIHNSSFARRALIHLKIVW